MQTLPSFFLVFSFPGFFGGGGEAGGGGEPGRGSGLTRTRGHTDVGADTRKEPETWTRSQTHGGTRDDDRQTCGHLETQRRAPRAVTRPRAGTEAVAPPSPTPLRLSPQVRPPDRPDAARPQGPRPHLLLPVGGGGEDAGNSRRSPSRTLLRRAREPGARSAWRPAWGPPGVASVPAPPGLGHLGDLAGTQTD